MTELDKTCCFTGHRPEKLLGREEDIREWLRTKIIKAADDGCETFITGMAMGIDIWAAEEVLQLKEEGRPVKFACAVPFPGAEKNRSEADKEKFRSILAKADLVEYVSPKYTRWCFRDRNEWMVDRSGLVIAVYNGAHGGTGNTIRYAERLGRRIIVLDDSTLEEKERDADT